jgi:hypothetical protein
VRAVEVLNEAMARGWDYWTSWVNGLAASLDRFAHRTRLRGLDGPGLPEIEDVHYVTVRYLDGTTSVEPVDIVEGQGGMMLPVTPGKIPIGVSIDGQAEIPLPIFHGIEASEVQPMRCPYCGSYDVECQPIPHAHRCNYCGRSDEYG